MTVSDKTNKMFVTRYLIYRDLYEPWHSLSQRSQLIKGDASYYGSQAGTVRCVIWGYLTSWLLTIGECFVGCRLYGFSVPYRPLTCRLLTNTWRLLTQPTLLTGSINETGDYHTDQDMGSVCVALLWGKYHKSLIYGQVCVFQGGWLRY